MMKIKSLLLPLFIILLVFVLSNNYAFSKENDNTVIEGEVIELDTGENSTAIEEGLIEKSDLKSKISDYYKYDKGIINLQLNEHLKLDFGIIGSMNWAINNDDNYVHSNFHLPSADIILSGKINDYFDYKAQVLPNVNINKKTILGDVWVRGKYKNYSAKLGRMRKPFAYEPTKSPYDLDFATRSQIGRLFGDHRDSGGNILAEYKYADISLGLYASMQDRPLWFGQRGIEFDSSLTLKPLANLKDKGDLRIGGSIATGKRDYSYTNYAGFLTYDYKKFSLRSEYISKEASFYDEKKADGFYVDGLYMITDKLQAAVRFDSYNPDSKNSNKRTNEYVAGFNYFFNKQNIMLSLNYIFSDGDVDTQKVVAQMRYKTW